MAKPGSCLSTKVARDGEISIQGAAATSRHVGPGPQAAPGAGDGPRAACAFEWSEYGLEESLGPALSLPEHCMGMRAPSQHVSYHTELPATPSPVGTRRGRGHLPCSVPTALRPSTLQGPGSPPNAACMPSCQSYKMEITEGF